MTPDDEKFLRHAVEIARRAGASGERPFGSLLAAADGTVLIEDHNTVVSESDITAHPELKLARWAARELAPDVAAELGLPKPALMPRIALQETCEPVTDPGRLAGVGTIEQITADLDRIRLLGAETVVLDPFNDDLTEIRQPERAWRTLAAVAAYAKNQEDR